MTLTPIFLLGNQREDGERPDKTQEHFIDTGKRRVSGLIPAMGNGTGVGEQACPRRERGEFDIRIRPGDTESKVKRASACIENQRGKEQVGFAQYVAALNHIQKCHEQQKGYRQPHKYNQGRTGCRGLLLSGFCFSHC